MNPNLVGLRFILEHGSFFGTVVPRAIAERLIEEFGNDRLPKVINNAVAQSPSNVGAWSVRSDKITCMHVFDAAEILGQQQQRPGVPFYPLSGR